MKTIIFNQMGFVPENADDFSPEEWDKVMETAYDILWDTLDPNERVLRTEAAFMALGYTVVDSDGIIADALFGLLPPIV